MNPDGGGWRRSNEYEYEFMPGRLFQSLLIWLDHIIIAIGTRIIHRQRPRLSRSRSEPTYALRRLAQ